ncbi:MAG: hypothetical protein K2O42_01525, partial [Oscillospiraceae bacterium]|nr:hypothetical protein [Oscillospiraceae bacterium]
MKKYLLLIPTLFVMLLNCITFGHVVAADDVIDYSIYHKDPLEVEEILSVFNFSSPDINIPYNPHYEEYIYYVFSEKDDVDRYLSGLSDSLSFRLIFYNLSGVNFSSDEISVVTNAPVEGKDSKYTYSKTAGGAYVNYGGGSLCYLRFNKDSGFLDISGGTLSLDQVTHY